MTLPTMAEITNLYLYKQKNVPSEEERINSQLITATLEPIDVDKNEFMDKETGTRHFIKDEFFIY